MSKLNKILIFLVIVLLMALGVVLYRQKGGFENPYYAVYLSSGDVYFGKLRHFPELALTDVWFLKRNENNSQIPVSLSKFTDAFWSPDDELRLNSDNVIWTAKLRDDSQVVQAIKNPQLLIQSPALNEPTTSSKALPR